MKVAKAMIKTPELSQREKAVHNVSFNCLKNRPITFLLGFLTCQFASTLRLWNAFAGGGYQYTADGKLLIEIQPLVAVQRIAASVVLLSGVFIGILWV